MIKKKDPNQEDKKTWEDYIKNPSDIYDKDPSNSNDIRRKERYKFDLHGFTLDEANSKVKEIIHHCVKNKCRELLLITGKGIHSTSDNDTYISKDLGKLKYSVPEFIKTNTELMSIIKKIEDQTNNKNIGYFSIYLKLKNKL